MRRRAVQIVCTIGPSSRSVETLRQLIDAGMAIARMNFAHGGPQEQRETVARIRAAAAERDRPVAILQDLSGPKLRLGELHEPRLVLETGTLVTIACDRDKGEPGLLPAPDRYLAQELRPGAPILIGDGSVELEVTHVEPPEIHCRVIVGGEITSGKGISTPGGLSDRPILDERDRADLALGAELGVDLVGVSYVRRASDLEEVRDALAAIGRSGVLVAKIETAVVLDHLDEVLMASDAVMIARGDLSLEIPYERVPIAQKRIVLAAIRAGRPVITATQMLHSMVSAARPTRAEIADVANAVLDGTDAVMLSDETAIGNDPVRACRAMRKIADTTLEAFPDFPETPLEGIPDDLRELLVFSRAAVRTARDTGVIAILTWSRGGLAARLLSRQRPSVPILAPTRFEETWRRLTLPFGCRPLLCPDGVLQLAQVERELGPVDGSDLVLVVSHIPGEQRRIPWMGLVRLADRDGWSRDPRDEGFRSSEQ
ncbi:MAG: pyruvate kinase [Myxococcota bacterium]